MKLIEAVAFVGLGAIWGSAFLFIKWSASPDGFPPFTLVAMRMLLAFCLFSLFHIIMSLAKKSHWATWKEHLCGAKRAFLWKVFFMGLLNNSIPFTLVAWGESQAAVSVGIASVLDSSIPLFGQLFGHFLLPNEKITWRRAIGLIVGFGGVVTVCAERLFYQNDDTSNATVIGYYMMIVGATASYALASIYGKRVLSDYDGLVTAWGQITSATLINITIACAWEYNDPISPFSTHFDFLWHASLKAWIGILYLGIVSTCVAYVLYFFLLRTIGSVKQTMVGFLLPVFGVFEGAMFENEWAGVPWWYKLLEVLGALFIVCGVYFVNFSPPSADLPPKIEKITINDEDDDEEARALLDPNRTRTSQINSSYGTKE